MKDHFHDISLIVVTPDESKENVDLGYQLRPRFLTGMNGDLSVIFDILLKMKEKIEKFYLKIHR